MAFYDVSPGETASQGIGKSIGQSIGAGLQQMAQEKVSERLRALEAKRTAAGLEAIMKDSTPEQRMAVANMPLESQKVAMQGMMKMQQQARMAELLNGGLQPPNDQQGVDSMGGYPGQEQTSAPVSQGGIPEATGSRPTVDSIVNRYAQDAQGASKQKEASIKNKYAQDARRANQVMAIDGATGRAMLQNAAAERDQSLNRAQKEGHFLTDQAMKTAQLKEKEMEGVTRNLQTIPHRILEYDKVISILKKNPQDVRTGSYNQLLFDIGLGGYGRTTKQGVVENALKNIQISRVEAFRGLGSMSDKDFNAAAVAEPNLMQTPEGMVSVAEGKRAMEKSQLAIDKTYDKILQKNGGFPPMDIKFQAIRDTEKEREKYAEAFKNAYRKVGVEFPGDRITLRLSKASEKIMDKRPDTTKEGNVWIDDNDKKFIFENGKWRDLA